MKSLSELIIKYFECSFGNFKGVIEIVKYFKVLCDLSDNEINVFTRFFLHSKINTCTFQGRMMYIDSIIRSWSSLYKKIPFWVFWSFCLKKIDLLMLTTSYSWNLLIIFIEIFFRLRGFFRFWLLSFLILLIICFIFLNFFNIFFLLYFLLFFLFFNSFFGLCFLFWFSVFRLRLFILFRLRCCRFRSSSGLHLLLMMNIIIVNLVW